MSSVDKYFRVESGSLVESTDKDHKSALSEVVNVAVDAIQSNKNQLSYSQVNDIYTKYKGALKKRAFGGFLIWWNKGKIEALKKTRESLVQELLKDPTSAG